MRRHIMAVTAFCIFLSSAVAQVALVNAQEAQSAHSRQKSGAPATTPEPVPEPANPLPEGQAPQSQPDHQTPAAPNAIPGSTGQKPGVPLIPPGAAETPSTSPATPSGPVEPSATVMLSLDAYLGKSDANRGKEHGDKRRRLIGRSVLLPDGGDGGAINGFVVRNGRNLVRLALPETPNDKAREVVVPSDMLFITSDGDRVVIKAQSRDDLKNLPEFRPENYEKVK